MAKKAIFYPTADGDVASYFNNVVTVLIALAPKYGTSPALITLLNNYNTEIPIAKSKSDADQQKAKASVQSKDELFSDARTDLMRELRRMNDLANFDEADAILMGIRKEIKDVTEQSKASSKAIISGITLMPEEVVIDWIKSKMDGVAIYSSLDGVNFQQIDVDMRSPYGDKRKNKTAGVPEVRYYKLRYLLKDEQVGQFSDVSSATVLL
jgi:hypothetical protein